MHVEKWDSIIVDWINCLKLSGRVKKIQDLRNGLFFNDYLKFVVSDTFCPMQNILQSLTRFLKDRYPNIGFLCENDHLQDLEYDNIVIISSLLLHYSCICDRRICFTFPLCHQLSREVQICIKTFLENVTTNSTIDQVFDSIKIAANKCVKPKYIYTNSSNIIVGCNPLQELLNVSSNQFASLERLDEVLNTLEIDIQELPDKHYENKESNGTEVEINDDVVWWTSGFDYNVYYDTNTTEKMLRDQIRELEECFQKLDLEQAHLRMEKNVLHERIEKLDMLKYDNDGLFNTKQPEVQLNQLDLILMDLTTLMEAIQKCEDNPVSSVPNCIERNQEDSEKIVKCNLENACNLKKNIEEFCTSYGELEDNYASTKKMNEDYILQESAFCNSQTELDHVRVELETSAEELLSFLKQNNSPDINKLEEELNASRHRIEELLCDFNDVLNEPLQTLCETSECDVNPLGEEILAIEIQYYCVLNNYNKNNFYLSSITTNFNLVEDKLRRETQKLEELCCNFSVFSYFDCADIQLNIKDSYNDTIVICQELIAELKLNVLIYSEKTVITFNEYHSLNNQLKRALAQGLFLEEQISRHVRNITMFENNIFEVTTTINELQLLEDDPSLSNTESSLNIKLFQYLHKLEEDKILLDNLYKSIDNLEEIKTDIDGKLTALENTTYQLELFELKALRSVFDEDILKKVEESIRSKKTIKGLQANVDTLRQQLLQIKNYRQMDTQTVTCFQEDIEAVNEEIRYYQMSIHDFELETETLKSCLAEAEQDLEMAVDTKKELEDIINYAKIDFDQRILILDGTAEEIEQEVIILNAENIKLKSEVEENWTIYLKKQHDYEFRQFKQIESNVEDVTKTNDTISYSEEQLPVLQNQISNIQEKCKILNTKHLILTNLRLALEEDYKSEILLNLFELYRDLSTKQDQLKAIICKYKKQEQDIEIKMTYLKSALFEDSTESQNSKLMGNHNIDKISQIHDELYELNKQITTKNIDLKESVKKLRTTTATLPSKIETYLKSLDDNYETNNNHRLQLKILKQNRCEILEKSKTLESKHQNTINELESTQDQLESLECQKLEFETQLLQQNVYFEKEYEININKLILNMEDLIQKESQLKTQLAKTMNELQGCDWSNTRLYTEFNLMCTEFSNVKDDKAYVDAKLENFDFFGRVLKEDSGSFTDCRLKTLEENSRKMSQLQSDLSRHIEMLLSENINIKASIARLQNYVIALQDEHDLVAKTRLEHLKKMENEKIMLENENKTDTDNVNVLIEEKDLLDEDILEEDKYSENNVCLFMLSAKDIFETGRRILEKNIGARVKKVEDVKKDMLRGESLFREALESKDSNIKDIRTKIKLLQIELGENSSKNNKLFLELCTVNASLSSLSRQHTTLKQALSKQTEESKETEPVKVNKEVFIQNMKSKNLTLSTNIILVKEKIERLKETLKSSFVKRQTLDLEWQVIDEKIEHHQYHLNLKKDHKIIFDIHAELSEKLNDIVKLQNCKSSLQNKLKMLSLSLSKIKNERRCAVKNRIEIFKDAQVVFLKIHKNTIDVQSTVYLDKDVVFQDTFKKTVAKLIEAEKIAKEILEIQMLELCSEKHTLLQLYMSLHHYVNCILRIFKDVPIKFSFNNDVTLVNINDDKVLNKTTNDVEDKLVSCLTAKTKEIYSVNTVNLENLTNIYCTLNSIKTERWQIVNLVQHLQKAHSTLTKKYHTLVASSKDTKNLKGAFKIAQNIVSLEREATILYSCYKKFDGYPIGHSVVLNKLILQRNYLDDVLKTVSENLEFLLTELLNNKNAKSLEQLSPFQTVFYDIYHQFMEISRQLYEILQTVIEVSFEKKITNNIERVENVNSEKAFDEIEQCCKSANGLLKDLQMFQRNCHLKLVYPIEFFDSNSTKTNLFHNKNGKEDGNVCEAIKANFAHNVKKYRREYELLKEYSDRCTFRDINNSDFSNVATEAHTQSLLGGEEVANVDKGTQILQAKKAKLEACYVDLEQIKQCDLLGNFGMAKNKDVVVQTNKNKFTIQSMKKPNAAAGDFIQKADFGQQYSNNQMLALCESRQNKMTSDFHKKQSEVRRKQLKQSFIKIKKSKNKKTKLDEYDVFAFKGNAKSYILRCNSQNYKK